MIEKTVRDYLAEKLSVSVYMEVPEDPAESFVVIEKTGSGRENMISSAVITVQSYAGTKYGAAVLNEAVKEAMDSLITLSGISRSALNSDYDFTDPSTKRYRYQAVYDIVYYD